MALSDEDYGILYNAILAGPNQLDNDTITIVRNALSSLEKAYIFTGCDNVWPKVQHLKDYATLLILEEGRELP